MIVFNELTEDNLFFYFSKHYRNPQFTDIEEFYEDLKRFKYIKRLINRYIEHDELAERLILNHLIVIFNSFGIEGSLNILELKMDEKHWPVLKPFLIYLKYITNDQYIGTSQDPGVVDKLRNI